MMGGLTLPPVHSKMCCGKAAACESQGEGWAQLCPTADALHCQAQANPPQQTPSTHPKPSHPSQPHPPTHTGCPVQHSMPHHGLVTHSVYDGTTTTRPACARRVASGQKCHRSPAHTNGCSSFANPHLCQAAVVRVTPLKSATKHQLQLGCEGSLERGSNHLALAQ